jgi:hypothetical protein
MESYDSEENSFDIELPNGYISVHVEYKCDEDVAAPTGRYFCYMLDDRRGSSLFYLKMNDNAEWVAENQPSHMTADLINMIAKQIEEYDG